MDGLGPVEYSDEALRSREENFDFDFTLCTEGDPYKNTVEKQYWEEVVRKSGYPKVNVVSLRGRKNVREACKQNWEQKQEWAIYVYDRDYTDLFEFDDCLPGSFTTKFYSWESDVCLCMHRDHLLKKMLVNITCGDPGWLSAERHYDKILGEIDRIAKLHAFMFVLGAPFVKFESTRRKEGGATYYGSCFKVEGGTLGVDDSKFIKAFQKIRPFSRAFSWQAIIEFSYLCDRQPGREYIRGKTLAKAVELSVASAGCSVFRHDDFLHLMVNILPEKSNVFNYYQSEIDRCLQEIDRRLSCK